VTADELVPPGDAADVFEPKAVDGLGSASATADHAQDEKQRRREPVTVATTQLAVNPLRVLVVEDAAADAELLAAMLEVELPGAVLRIAATLAGGLELLADPVDAVITDLSLPDADHLSALLAIRAAVPDMPVLVLTGRRDSELGMAAMIAGADDYLLKGSLDSHALATAVQYAVQRRKHQQANRRFERLALSLLDSMESPTCAVSHSGHILAVNRAWTTFTALPTTDADLGRSYFDLCAKARPVDPTAMEAVGDGLRNVLSGAAPRFQLDYPTASDAGLQWFSIRVSPLPEAAGAVLTHVDVTVAKRAEQALAHQTLHDGLTDLPNRDLLSSRLSRALSASSRRGLSVGVGFLDLDQFKRINDSLGHQAGDELLVAVAERLGSRLRAGDTLARFAGDEFVVVWPDLPDAAAAETLADRLALAFEDPFVLQQATVALTASIGVAVGAAPQLPDQLLLAADAAMYDAKGRGRGRTRMFSAELREGAESRLRLEAELREALEHDQFVVHYQPVVDLQQGTVRGVEALVRWNHPDGVRMPDSFIPVAEASGMIVPLGTWVLKEACRQAGTWQRDGLDLDIAVNLSVRQVAHPDLVGTIRDTLAACRLEPHRLMLEVTESVMLEDAEAAQTALSRIAELGATIAIDDFGTGYSSLLYLKRYPVRALKVDRTFVAGMGNSNDDHAIVTSVVSLARAVGSVCIAEGVETEEQHAALRAMSCDYAQGYLFGRPMPAEEVPAAIAACAARLSRPVPAGSAATTPAATAPAVEPFVLDRIQQMHQAGASLHTIAAALNREHAPHPDAIRWHGVTVAQVVAGSYRPARRRTNTSRASQRSTEPARRHRTLMYDDAADLARVICDGLVAALDGSEAVLVIAGDVERQALEKELVLRGLDLDALSLASQYRTWDADVVLDQITVDGYISGRLFRQVLGERVETTLARFGRVRVYGSMAGQLWERGEVTSALALEELWEKLAGRLCFDVVCCYRRAAVDGEGTDVDRSCLQHKHADAA
jgi:diguanylate cyclase (GGDEF)-like protein